MPLKFNWPSLTVFSLAVLRCHFIYLFIFTVFLKHSINAYRVDEFILEAGDTAVNKTNMTLCLLGDYISVGEYRQ